MWLETLLLVAIGLGAIALIHWFRWKLRVEGSNRRLKREIDVIIETHDVS